MLDGDDLHVGDSVSNEVKEHIIQFIDSFEDNAPKISIMIRIFLIIWEEIQVDQKNL